MTCAGETENRCWMYLVQHQTGMCGIMTSTLMALARMPSPLARLMNSEWVMVALGRPMKAMSRSRGSATSPTPANTMKSSHPADTTVSTTLMVLMNCD